VSEAKSGGEWKPRNPSLAILVAVVVPSLLVAIAGYVKGKQLANERHFIQDYRTPMPHEASAYCATDYIDHFTEHNDVIVFGDSAGMNAVNTPLLQQETGLSAMNCSCVGHIGLDGLVILSERYLEHRSKPRLLVVCINPHRISGHQFPPTYARARDWFFWCYGPRTEPNSPSHECPLFCYHIREGTCFAVGRLAEQMGNPPLQKSGLGLGGRSYEMYREDWLGKRGYAEGHLVIEGYQPRTVTVDPFEVTAQARVSWRALARLTREHSVPMLIRLTPIIDEGFNDSAHLHAFFGELQSEFPHVAVSSPELLLYPADHFRERLHVNDKGATLCTRVLADSVTQVLARK
jgi:hypothetical protein